MKTYLVKGQYRGTYSMMIEAKSKGDALKKAKFMPIDEIKTSAGENFSEQNLVQSVAATESEDTDGE